MNDRLSNIYLLPPPIGTPWAGTPGQTTRSDLTRHGLEPHDRPPITIELPLFWCDPHWSALGTSQADEMAVAVARRNVLVSALRSDLSGAGEEGGFHSERVSESADKTQVAPPPPIFPRVVPYRPERYGLSPKDFDGALLVDVRMMTPRDHSGRFAYAPEQIQRWEATPTSEPLAGGSWVPAATFLPDVDTVNHLGSKLNQLRRLAPSAAICVSIGAYRMEQEIPAVILAKPDVLIVRMDEVELDPLQLAALTRRARQLIDEAGADATSFWIVPGEVTPDDAVKLVALGADAVGIDSWCNPLVETIQESIEDRSFVPGASIERLVEYALEDQIERFAGLYLSLQKIPKSEQLGSFSATWARSLNIRALR